MGMKFAWSHLNLFSSKSSNTILFFLLAVDVIFMAINVYAVLFDLDKPEYAMLYVDSDRGFAERFQYLKFALLILGSLYLVFKKRYGYLPWCLLFAAMLFDDASELHETVGEWIAVRFNFEPLFGLRAVDLGELCYAAAFGLVMLSLFYFFYKSGSQRFKSSSKDLALLLLLFICFGVGVDMLHSLVLENPPLAKIVALVEDGGEMVAISLIVWYFAFIIGKGDLERNYLYRIFTS